MMRRALQYASITGRPLALHCEEPSLSRGGHVHEGAAAAELGFTGYPSIGESVMVERDLALAAFEEQPIHLLHLSAAESVAALRRAREHGVRASGEVTPHHLVLTDDAVRTLDTNVKMSPPLRAERDRVALLDALRDGTIEAIATDHAPHARHEKDVPFEAAPFGVTGLETAFAVLYSELVEPGHLPLQTLLARLSAGPARIFGLERPRIAAGVCANVVLLDLAGVTRDRRPARRAGAEHRDHAQRNQNAGTPAHGRRFPRKTPCRYWSTAGQSAIRIAWPSGDVASWTYG